MNRCLRTLLIFLISPAIFACVNRAPSLRMLNVRSQYEDPAGEARSLELGAVYPVPTKTEPRVRKVWIHPFEMTTGDYFWGGFMSMVTEEERWILRYPEAASHQEKAPAITKKIEKKKKK